MPFASSAPDTSATNGTTYLRNRRFRVHGASQWLTASTARAYRSRGASLDELIRTQQQRLGDSESQGLGGLHVYHQLVLAWCFDRKGSRVGAPQDLIDKEGSAAELLAQANRVGHEGPHLNELPGRAHRRQPMLTRLLGDAPSLREQERVCGHDERVNPLPSYGCERAFQVVPIAHIYAFDL